MSGSALPPDVRRWLCQAIREPVTLGYARGAAFGPVNTRGAISRTKGIAPGNNLGAVGGAQPPLTSGGEAEATRTSDFGPTTTFLLISLSG